jgi:serine protease Do
MNPNRSRHVVTLLLVACAVVFGMVLSGSLGITAPGATEPEKAVLSATQLAASNAAVRGLPSFADLAQAVDPAVVSIQAATIEKSANRRRGGLENPLDFFFGPQGQQQRRGRPNLSPDGEDGTDEQRSDAGGSGFVISRDGLVVTNYHVVEGATEVKVHLGDRDYPAKIQGTDQSTDIALLKINAGHDLRYLELGDSDKVRVGDWVMVVGNPLNLDKTVTTGVISAKGRSLGISDASFENFIQTDAAINFGNSGGPLIDLQGEVVAIATAINYGAENIGFAVPVNTLKEILPQLRDKGRVSRGYLGVEIKNLDYNLAQSFGLATTDGALVGNVNDNTPAADAGIKHGDIIQSVDGRHIKTTRDLISYISEKGPNQTVTLSVLREGKSIERKVKLGERPAGGEQTKDEKPGRGKSGIDWLGLQYQDLSDGLRGNLNLPGNASGIVVTNVSPSSPLYEQGVRAGFVITEVNGEAVKNVADFERAVQSAKSKSYVRFYALRPTRNGNNNSFFAVAQVP